MIPPTSLDVFRTIQRLAQFGGIAPGETVKISGQDWTYRELIDSIGNQISFVLNVHGVSTRKFTKREARVIMGAAGVSDWVIDYHARAVAASVRAHTTQNGRMSAR